MAIASGASGGYPGGAGVAIGSGQTPPAPTDYGNATNGPTFIPSP